MTETRWTVRLKRIELALGEKYLDVQDLKGISKALLEEVRVCHRRCDWLRKQLALPYEVRCGPISTDASSDKRSDAAHKSSVDTASAAKTSGPPEGK